MKKNYITSERIMNIDFTKNKLDFADYEQCEFYQCNFNSNDLSEINFIDCKFLSCDLSLAKLEDASFQNVIFKACKMIGLNLETCNKFGLKVMFDHCLLNDSSFYELKLSKTHFKDCTLQNVDFAYADLSQTYFENCNLKNAIFEQTNLEKANLTSSYNFSINPTKNKIKNAKFSRENCIGLLDSFNIKIE